MKQYIKTLIGAVVVSCAATTLSAQALRSGYFSDSYIYRHQMNPALHNTSGYVSMPMLGGINMDAGMNFGVKNFIFEKPDGTLTTFMHESVSADQFLGDLKDKNTINMSYEMNILSVGFNAFGGYNTFDVGAHINTGFVLPKNLFAFMKEMKSDKTYDFGDLEVAGRGYVDVALGHSRQINEALRVGAKLKVIVGLAYADAAFNGCSARFGSDKWQMSMNGTATLGVGGYFTSDEDGKVDGYEDATAGVNGLGFGVDLGATYDMKDLVDGLKLSAAVTNIGYIKWTDCAVAQADGTPFEFDGFHNLGMHEGEGTIDEQWKDIEDDLEDMYNLSALEELSDEKESLGATVTIGAEYELPVYKKLSFGLLYTQRFSDVYGYAEGRINVNYAPARLLDLSLSGAVTSYGACVGALLNLHLPGFNLYFGTDRIYTGSCNSDMIPLEKGGLNFAMGLNFPFGF